MVSVPHGLEPFRADLESGKPMPLFVPAELVDECRKRWPRMWIVEIVDIPTLGKAITHAEWERQLQQSSEDSSKDSSEQS